MDICKHGVGHVRPVGTQRECRRGDKCVNMGGAHSKCEHTGQGCSCKCVHMGGVPHAKSACKAQTYRAYAHVEEDTESIHRGSWSVLRKILRLSQGF